VQPRSLALEPISPKPFRKVHDDEPLTKSRKENADSSPSRKIIEQSSGPDTSDRLFDDIQKICKTKPGQQERSDRKTKEVQQQQQQRQRGVQQKDEIQSTLDSLLAEVDQQIRFSICLDEEINEKSQDGGEDENSCDSNYKKNEDDEIRNDLSAMKRSIDQLRTQLTSTKANLASDRKPLMDMVNSLAVASEKAVASSTPGSPYFNRPISTNSSSAASPYKRFDPSRSEMEEAKSAMTQLERTISEMKRPTSIKVR
jgi:hypothetical protein